MVGKKEHLELLNEVMMATILSKAECRLPEPLIDKPYYLYQRPNSSSFISLIEKEYWDYDRFKIKFMATVTYTSDGSWKIIAA
tara:strand:- start:1356 stop:1604 length:249 start_codon:yes stop_codon:yes gene_type:complete